jgi:hypothetical protein
MVVVFRAPGCEKKVVEIAADYEQKRLLATKAIQQKPAGEERTPNSVWSGLGFSSSMPAAVIRYSTWNFFRNKYPRTGNRYLHSRV